MKFVAKPWKLFVISTFVLLFGIYIASAILAKPYLDDVCTTELLLKDPELSGAKYDWKFYGVECEARDQSRRTVKYQTFTILDALKHRWAK